MTTYKRTFSAGSKKTSVGNDVIQFLSSDYPYPKCNVQFFHFQTFGTACSIKLNNESTVHWVDVNSEFIISDIYVDKVTIVDAGVDYYYTAMSID